jgi:hypothetical protein
MSAKILPFAFRERSPDAKRDADAPTGAILMFTGVRYERLPEPSELKSCKPAKRRPQAVPAC